MKKKIIVFAVCVFCLLKATAQSGSELLQMLMQQSTWDYSAGSYVKLFWVGEDKDVTVKVTYPYFYKLGSSSELDKDMSLKCARSPLNCEIKSNKAGVVSLYPVYDSLVVQFEGESCNLDMNTFAVEYPDRLINKTAKKFMVTSPATTDIAVLSSETHGYLQWSVATCGILIGIGNACDKNEFLKEWNVFDAKEREKKNEEYNKKVSDGFKQLAEENSWVITFVYGARGSEKTVQLSPQIEFFDMK